MYFSLAMFNYRLAFCYLYLDMNKDLHIINFNIMDSKETEFDTCLLTMGISFVESHILRFFIYFGDKSNIMKSFDIEFE